MTRREQPHRPWEPECREAHAALEARLVDSGSLDASQEQALASHLESCEACADFDRIARHIGELPPQSTEMVRIRSVAAAKTIYFRRRKKRRAAVVGIAAAAAAALVLTLFPTGFNANAPDVMNNNAQLPASGERLTLLDGRVTLSSSAQTSLETVLAADDDMHVRIEDGFMCAQIDPTAKRRVHFRVVTPLGKVDVKGTIFGVTVADGTAEVAVVRGEVTAEPTDSARAFSVRAGSVFDFGTRQTTSIDDDTDTRIRAMLGLHPKKSEPSGDTEPASSADDVSAAESSIDATNRGGSQSPKSQAFRTPRPSLETLLDEADRCRIDHDWRCAAKRYDAIVKRFPHRAEAATALVNLGQIQLKHLKKPREARRNFERYQKQSPSGPLAEQALMGIARADRAIGDHRGEARALDLFLARHPSSPLAEAARRRRVELKKNH